MDPDEPITVRLQYLADIDPFNSLSMYPIPSRAPTYSFINTTPLATQIGAILRLLGAPQRVRNCHCLFFRHFTYYFFSYVSKFKNKRWRHINA